MYQNDAAQTERRGTLLRSRDLARLRAFGSTTYIETPRGPVPASDLRVGDLLVTSTGGHAEITWTDRIHLDESFLRTVPSLKPVLIGEGELGFAPLRNVVLSPEQFVWDPSEPKSAGFRRAADVTRHPNLFKRRDIAVTYISLLCAEPVVIEAEGLWISLIP